MVKNKDDVVYNLWLPLKLRKQIRIESYSRGIEMRDFILLSIEKELKDNEVIKWKK